MHHAELQSYGFIFMSVVTASTHHPSLLYNKTLAILCVSYSYLHNSYYALNL